MPVHPAHQRRLFLIAALVLLTVPAVLLAATVAGQAADDVFITYRYAQNLVEGHGFVFNPGERVLATTAPGWGLLLALLHGLTGVALPVLGTWATAFCLLAMALLILWDTRGREPEALAGGLLLVTCVYLWTHNGFELPAVLLALLVAARVAGRHPAAAGCLAGCACWLRPDAAVGVAALGLLLWLEERRGWRRLGVYALAAGAVVAAGLAAAWWYYGEPLPVTLEAKRVQARWRPETWHSGARFWVEGYRWLGSGYAGGYAPVLAVLGLLGLASLWRTGRRPLRLLGLFALALLVAYPLLGVPFYTWYLIPVLIAWLYGAAFLVGDLLRLLWRSRRLPRWPRLVSVALVLALLTPPVRHVLARAWYGYQHFEAMPRLQVYRQAAAWIAANTSEEAEIAFVEVGAVAFYSQRRVHDLLGLVSPTALPHAARGDLRGAFAEHPTQLFLTAPHLHGFLEPILTSEFFQREYEKAAEFAAGQPGNTYRVEIYRRRTSTRASL